MAGRDYLVTLHGWAQDGSDVQVLKWDDDIDDCRRWAARAFPGIPTTVTRPYRFCDRCQSSPCCCRRRLSRVHGRGC